MKVLSSLLLVFFFFIACGGDSDPNVAPDTSLQEVSVLTDAQDLDGDTSVALDDGAGQDAPMDLADVAVSECGVDQVMTANGCEGCDLVISNVSQQVSALANSHRVCTADSDCASVIPQTGCKGFCPYAVSQNKKALFLAEVAALSEENCSDPDFPTKCGFMTPSCGNTQPKCEGGLCLLKEVKECLEENPAGCIKDDECSEGEVCKFSDAICLPSTCFCDTNTGDWVCTPDCVGQCIPDDASACEGPNPQGCITTGCPEGQSCDVNQGNKPTSCHCSDASDPPNWNCTKDDLGGVCVEN